MPRLRGTLKIGEVFAECVKKYFDLLGMGVGCFLSCHPTHRRALDYEGKLCVEFQECGRYKTKTENF